MKQITLRLKDGEDCGWQSAAIDLGMSIPTYVAYATAWATRYFLEVKTRKRADAVAVAIEEKKLALRLLEVARLCEPYVPKFVDRPIHGRVYLQQPLQDVIRDIRSHAAYHGDWAA